MSTIRRHTVEVTADDSGVFAPVTITPPGPCMLLALETTPTVALSDRFDVVLRSADAPDEACGAGLGRSGSVAERRVCRVLGTLNMHVTVVAGKALDVVVTGNRVPHAMLSVSILVAVP